MVIAPDMSKPILKVSGKNSLLNRLPPYSKVNSQVNIIFLIILVSDDELSSDTESEVSRNDEEMDVDASGEDPASSASGEEDDEEALMSNKGWGDSISKILGSSKPKNKKTLVLSRAKKYSAKEAAVKEEKPAFEIIGEAKPEKTTLKKEDPDGAEPVPKKKVS